MKRIDFPLVLLSAVLLGGCIRTYYPAFYGRLGDPVTIPMESDRRNCFLTAVSADAGRGWISDDDEGNEYLNVSLGLERYDRIGGGGFAVEGVLGRARVDSVPGYNGTWTYYDIAPDVFWTLFAGREGWLVDVGGRLGLFFEGGAYPDFRKTAEAEHLITRMDEDYGVFGNGFVGLQIEHGRYVYSLQGSVGFPDLAKMSLAFGKSGHNVWVSVFPAKGMPVYSFGYKYWIR